MFELILITIGSMTSIFCGYKFALLHLTKNYSGIFDLIVRILLVIGVITNALLMPIWLQKSKYPNVHVGIFILGPYLGFSISALSSWLEYKGKLRWPKEKR